VVCRRALHVGVAIGSLGNAVPKVNLDFIFGDAMVGSELFSGLYLEGGFRWRRRPERTNAAYAWETCMASAISRTFLPLSKG